MPRKSKPRKPVASPDEVWIAPRPSNTSSSRTFEPVGTSPTNRYLEFADIALGAKMAGPRKRKAPGSASHAQKDQNPDSKVTSINSAKPSNRGLGAFRNPR